MQNKSLKIAVCAICRNEVDYIEEWVSFYKVAGFDSIYIYDNVSDDGSSELLSSLDAAGQIKRVHWPRKEGVPPQRDAYGDFLHNFAQNYDYVLVCDLDEFLVVSDGNIKSLISEAEAKHGNVGAIGFPWLMFGSGGAEQQQEGLVIERFTNCESKVVRTVKTLYCSRNTYNMRTHVCDLINGVYLDNRLELARFDAKMPIKLKSTSAGKAVMHHYYTKSKSEWMRRRAQPKADRAKIELKNVTEFERFNSLDSNVFSAKEKAPEVRSVMASLKDARSQLESACASAEVQLVAVNNDWLFGIVTGLDCAAPLAVRLGGDEGQETFFYTKPISSKVHGFTVKSKWRKYYSAEFTMSVIGSRKTQVFRREDFPSIVSSIKLMNKYMPVAEQHLFSTFLNSLAERPSAELMAEIKEVEFNVNQDYFEFCLSLDKYLKDLNKSDFVESYSALNDSSKSFIMDAKGAVFIKNLLA
ncbi:glycosyltransferase family 2 protein [Pseudomonas sp. Pse1]|uniref:glycosyltransferase family 2 protein n=1 Tax=Pseudomonas sp. Pse1 TaxID=2926020 RepID=UPI000489C9EE|nr:glycosyltransferase family 2 protein [Pseudomonas sp. Pse1]